MSISCQIRLCQNPDCGLRYPLTDNNTFGERCPVCLGETKVVVSQVLNLEGPPRNLKQDARVHILLDNVRSAWNVGAIFRTADGLGLEKLYLCGITPTPDNSHVRKTALGAENTVAWEYSRNSLLKAESLKCQGAELWALEQDHRAIPVGTDSRIPTTNNIILILGNEVTGVDPQLLDLCDRIVYIPMQGKKKSLNVEVAFGIAAYTLLSRNIYK